MSGKNKIKFGLTNVHYADVIEGPGGTITYGTPKRLPGGVSLVLSAEGEEYKFYADNMLYFSTFTNDGYAGDIVLAVVPDDFGVDVMGDIVDANGVIFEDSKAISKPIALMYEFSGDKKGTRHVNYNVTVSRPNVEGETKAAGMEAKTETLSITAAPALDTGLVKAKALQGQIEYDNWFEKVYTYVEPAGLAKLVSIAITKPATKQSYAIGEELGLEGLVITGTYDDESTKVQTITPDNVTGFDSSVAKAKQTLTITVDGKTTTYDVAIA